MPRGRKPHTGATSRHAHPWRCDSCDSGLVHPIGAVDLGGGSWQVELRCAECERRSNRSCSAAAMDDLDSELDRATGEIAAELKRLEAVHMREWAERFVEALRRDLVGPDDFRPWLH
jgi:hypothetical protein